MENGTKVFAKRPVITEAFREIDGSVVSFSDESGVTKSDSLSQSYFQMPKGVPLVCVVEVERSDLLQHGDLWGDKERVIHQNDPCGGDEKLRAGEGNSGTIFYDQEHSSKRRYF